MGQAGLLEQIKAHFEETGELSDLMCLCLDYFPDMIWIVDETARYRFVNQALCSTLGYTQEELLNLHVYDVDLEVSSKLWQTMWNMGFPTQSVLKRNATFENKLRTKDGRIICIQNRVTSIKWPDKTGCAFAVAREIGTQDMFEMKMDILQLALSRQKALLNNIPYIAWMKDSGLRYIAVNDAFLNFCGRTEEEVIGRTDFDLWPKEMAEDIVANNRMMIETKTRVQAEEMLRDAQGNLFWCDVFTAPVFDPDSRLHAGAVGIALDITERKITQEAIAKAQQALQDVNLKLNQELHERKILESQLVQSQKMESIGHLAAGVAHEINNPIGFVQSNLHTLSDYVQGFKAALNIYRALQPQIQTLAGEHPEILADLKILEAQGNLSFICEDVDDLLAESTEGVRRVSDIVKGLRNFARPGESAFQEVNINECIESTLKISANELKYKCTIEKQFGELPLLKCYPSQLNQVFLNILVNAAQAISEKGIIEIKTAFENDRIMVKISDTGEGISPENLPAVFNPFFTTKPVGQGTGLGLSISYDIIQKHQGSIEVESELGKGATFTISLPVT